MAAELREAENKLNMVTEHRVKIVEEGGDTIFNTLSRKNPLGSQKCEDKRCLICTYKGSKGQCRVRSVLYKNTCIICEEKGILTQYFGESSKSAGEQSYEHMRDALQKKQASHI